MEFYTLKEYEDAIVLLNQNNYTVHNP